MDAITTPAKQTDQDDAKLAAKIIDAMKAVDAATAARNEKAVAAGRLLIEAQKRHPTEKAFEKFLQLAGGVQIRRARDLIALALGRKDFEQHQIESADELVTTLKDAFALDVPEVAGLWDRIAARHEEVVAQRAAAAP